VETARAAVAYKFGSVPGVHLSLHFSDSADGLPPAGGLTFKASAAVMMLVALISDCLPYVAAGLARRRAAAGGVGARGFILVLVGRLNADARVRLTARCGEPNLRRMRNGNDGLLL
jgi:hypothetical protein